MRALLLALAGEREGWMARRKTELIDRVATRGEDGRTVIVEVWQEFTESVAMGRDPEWLDGLKRATLSDGSHVNYRSDGSYEVVQTGERLTVL